MTASELEGPPSSFDFWIVLGLPVHQAESIAARAGFADVRVLEFVGEALVGAMDMSIQHNRLNLEVEDERVRPVNFGS